MRLILCILVLSTAPAFTVRAEDEGTGEATTRWNWDLTTALESYLHTYALATEDTTETLSEQYVQAGLEGRSLPGARHRWRLRLEASAGSELNRQRLEASYRSVDDRCLTRWGASGRLWARQYRNDSEYTRSSDVLEGRGTATWTPLLLGDVAWILSGWGSLNDYAAPSSLEVDRREVGAGLALRSIGLDTSVWGLVVKHAGRTYPDTTVINRHVSSLEGDFEQMSATGGTLRLYHRSDRRRAADEAVRPHAWTHWSDARIAVPAGAGQVQLEVRSEAWRYSQETDVYLDSWRQEAVLAYGWGDLLAARWNLGLAGERLLAGDSPEAYAQAGLRAGLESYGGSVSGSLILEYGRRVYAGDGEEPTPVSDLLPREEQVSLYSDFHYWKLWLMGTWHISDRVGLDVMANYEPETHTEQGDDTLLGFVSVRLVWRR